MGKSSGFSVQSKVLPRNMGAVCQSGKSIVYSFLSLSKMIRFELRKMKRQVVGQGYYKQVSLRHIDPHNVEEAFEYQAIVCWESLPKTNKKCHKAKKLKCLDNVCLVILQDFLLFGICDIVCRLLLLMFASCLFKRLHGAFLIVSHSVSIETRFS
ncbi:hypothetical protein BDA99DRAFT_536998 [Phascolomyces articulosus]|uniref:Uncharacterized protein n=1 Tax=Phascolomyces articulosus TaxID=60185 RepID=A0AAD5PEM6_9FUNG|nr:hypothetical protein BDA99DRAFT_536998 [Phascolomyces articulosus]